MNQLWHSQICAAFHRDLNSLRSQALAHNPRALNLFPYLKTLEVKQFADILLREIRTLSEGSETFSPTVSTLYRELGRKVMIRFQIDMKRRNGVYEKLCEVYQEFCDTIGASTGDNARQAWQRTVYHNEDAGPSMDLVDKPWPMAAQLGVGKFLYNILIRDLKIDSNATRTNAKQANLLPAFYSLFRYHGKIVKHEVKTHPVLIK